MVTFYKRASPQQRRMYKIVVGSVRNVIHHHPQYQLPGWQVSILARSIAKRVCGTLTAQMPEVLALPALAPSGKGDIAASTTSSSASQLVMAQSAPVIFSPGPRKKGRHKVHGAPSPFRKLKQELGILAGAARRAGKLEVLDAYAHALKQISLLEKAKQ